MIRPWPIAYATALVTGGLYLVIGFTPVTGAMFGVSLGAGAFGVAQMTWRQS